MNVGKRTKSVLSILLICGLLLVSVPCRSYAFGPVFMVPALSPAMKYAIGAGIVACGLYAANKDSLDYVINDYWNKASDYVKHQWQSAVTYGTSIGTILLNDPLKSSIKSYLDSNYRTGENVVTLTPTELSDATVGVYYDLGSFYIMGQGMSLGPEVRGINEYGNPYLRQDIMVGNTVITTYKRSGPGTEVSHINWVKVMLTGTGANDYLRLYLSVYDNPSYPDSRVTADISLTKIASKLGVTVSQLFYHGGETVTLNLVGDVAGFGNATEGRPEIKIPCPPVPAENWPDNWIDELEKELNRVGNPTIDDETMIEEWEEEWDWYIDENGNIYKVKKGQPPRKPDDEKILVPPTVLPQLPEIVVPEDYPKENDPEVTIEHHPPQTTVVEHPDGSRTETITQTSTITKKWWDPTAKRWRTKTEETTTTTKIDYAPDGTEIGRTTTTTTQPKGEREETATRDDTAINWEPLRRGLYELTEKFPFCLPWDLMRGIETLEANQWDRKIEINVGDGIWPEMVIDLTMFDNIARITRVILLIVFDLGLIFATRRLMGGDV